jgi:hypothetical protein
MADTFYGDVALIAASKNTTPMVMDGVVIPSNEFFAANLDSSVNLEQKSTVFPKIAWLMSFPNSGTSYTIALVRHLTMTSSATNYGHELNDGRESVPIYADQANGPFWFEAANQSDTYTRPTSYVMTKTHCGLRCEKCPPQSYVETTFSFRRNCLSGGRVNSNGTKELVSYPPDRVAKAIHLVRDPFDNVVSRFHLEQRKMVAEQDPDAYPSTREGFLAFCQTMNDAHQAEEDRAPFIHQSILAILEDVPCRADFIRFTEWHNLAFATTFDMGLETYVLHYDWYASRFNDTIVKLLDFLELEARAEPEPFLPDRVYKDYFTNEQRDRVKLALTTIASTESWKHLEQYFGEPSTKPRPLLVRS